MYLNMYYSVFEHVLYMCMMLVIAVATFRGIGSLQEMQPPVAAPFTTAGSVKINMLGCLARKTMGSQRVKWRIYMPMYIELMVICWASASKSISSWDVLVHLLVQSALEDALEDAQELGNLWISAPKSVSSWNVLVHLLVQYALEDALEHLRAFYWKNLEKPREINKKTSRAWIS